MSWQGGTVIVHVVTTWTDMHAIKIQSSAKANHICQFKLLTLTFKSLHGDTPEYIQKLLNRYRPRRMIYY